MIDDVHLGRPPVRGWVLGIDIDGVKHPVAMVEGSTENTTLVRELLIEHASSTAQCAPPTVPARSMCRPSSRRASELARPTPGGAATSLREGNDRDSACRQVELHVLNPVSPSFDAGHLGRV
jgi:hypothetical protein